MIAKNVPTQAASDLARSRPIRMPRLGVLTLLAIAGAILWARPVQAQENQFVINLPITVGGTEYENIVFMVFEVAPDPMTPDQTEQVLYWTGFTDCDPDNVLSSIVSDLTDPSTWADSAPEDAKDIRVLGSGADNCIDLRFVASEDWTFEVQGADGDDVVRGSAGEDVILGGPGDDVLSGNAGADVVSGEGDDDVIRGGPDADTLNGGAGFDVADYSEAGSVTVDLSAGPPGVAQDGFPESAEDTLGNVNTTSFEAIRGSAANDRLIGHSGDIRTTILGGGGDDKIFGGTAGDVLFGEAGEDYITGFRDLNEDGFPDDEADKVGDVDLLIGGLGPDRIWGGLGGDTLLGDGDAAPVWAPLCKPDPNLPGACLPNDPVAPVVLDDYVPPQTIPDNGGADLIFGGGGADLIFGGGGGDTINGDNGPSRAVETPVGLQLLGLEFYNDIIFGDFEDPSSLFGGSDRIRGGTGPDLLIGGFGSDLLIGGNDNEANTTWPIGDSLRGGPGNDTMIGGETDHSGNEFTASPEFDDNPYDIADYSSVPPAPAGGPVEIDLGLFENVTPGSGGTLFEGDGELGTDITFGMECIIGSVHDDLLTGNSVSNLVNGVNFIPPDAEILLPGTFYFIDGTISNIIWGGEGNDTIYGATGADLLFGELGNDSVFGDLTDGGAGGPDFVGGGEGDDNCSGQGGDDLVEGGPGNNRLSGGSGTDMLDYSVSNAITANLSNTAEAGQAPHTVTHGVELDTIVDCGDADQNCVIQANNVNSFVARFEIVNGSAFNDTIIGYESDPSQNNAPIPTSIFGMFGADTLIGGPGNDNIDGGPGSDSLEGRRGNDSLVGGPAPPEPPGLQLQTEQDTVSYASAKDPADTSTTGVTVNLTASGPQDTVLAGIDTLIEFENVVGSTGNDLITGNNRANKLVGLNGDDVLAGRSDQDVFQSNQTFKQEDHLFGDTEANGQPATRSQTFGNDRVSYITANPEVLSVSIANQEATNDGEGGSDQLYNIAGTIEPSDALLADAGMNQTISPGGSVLLVGKALGGIGNGSDNCADCYDFAWNTEPPITEVPGKGECEQVVPGLNDRCARTPTASPAATTKYRLTVKELDHTGARTGKEASAFVTVTVSSELIVNAGPDQTISLNDSAQLQGSVGGGVTPYAIVWSPSEGLSATNILLPTASPSVTTTYTLTVTDNLGKIASDIATVTVTNPFFVNAGADRIIAPGESITLNAAATGGFAPLSYQWTPPTALSSATVSNPVATPSATTEYTVSVTDSTGRTVSDSVVITVATASPPAGGTGGGNAGGGGPGGPGGGGGGGGSGSGSGTPPPESSPLFPFCGTGLGSAFLLANVMALLVMKRRRWH